MGPMKRGPTVFISEILQYYCNYTENQIIRKFFQNIETSVKFF